WCMTRSSTKEPLSPLKNPERVLRSRRKLFDNPSLMELNPLEDDQLSEIEEHIEEEVTEIMAETMCGISYIITRGRFLDLASF
ncbi:hypothetical protein Tco_1563632, partial [Tanacetum coccineum]